MVKNYNLCNDQMRRDLVVKIHVQNMSICKAAQELGIKYPTAKAINAVYLKQNRIKKKTNYEPRKKPTAARNRLKHLEEPIRYATGHGYPQNLSIQNNVYQYNYNFQNEMMKQPQHLTGVQPSSYGSKENAMHRPTSSYLPGQLPLNSNSNYNNLGNLNPHPEYIKCKSRPHHCADLSFHEKWGPTRLPIPSLTDS